MKDEIQITCDQARAIRKENVQRDTTEKKLISIIVAQEQFIEEMRDRSTNMDVPGLKTLVAATPQPVTTGGGVYSHAVSLV